ncbi:hypothetical protein [Pseudomonas sp. HY2-MNA-CIBAN-0224]|uniref:hypothetical protein n=1 Tax=Pseudomonas sp. HY2-MNA-CIBAN-0224 TaxID=3140471 RepID=UPI00332533C3
MSKTQAGDAPGGAVRCRAKTLFRALINPILDHLNSSVPEPDELEQDIEKLSAWRITLDKRLKETAKARV